MILHVILKNARLVVVSWFWFQLHVLRSFFRLEEQDNQGPPEKNGVRADSIIAKPGIPNGQPAGVQSHMEVVTFDPAQAYPEYIVKFTEE